jgi:hypothetical protein
VTLAPGTRLGPYEVLGAIGAGGMGEVYRAKDPRLARGVAVKVLPEEFFEGEERRQRFEREAKLLAALNHPNIAAIYSFEEIPSSSSSSSRHLLVMELVEGDDLARRISSGPLPLEESLSYARQIAEALEAAHEKGIVHRDLKPANVKVTPDGRVKLLDFGLAKIFESEASGSSPSISYSPTLTARGTAAGVILGTAAYMSPEQARGKSVDKRTDVWAFGCVLFEMLAGKRAFEGETVSDTLAAVLMKDPDWGALPEQTPAAVRKILRRCLQRDARLRLRDIGDARLELDELSARGASSLSAQLPFEENTALPGPTGGRSDSAASARGGRRLLFVSWALAAAFAAAAGALALRARAPRPADAVRLDMSVAPAERLGPTSAFQRPYLQSFALTPDGRRVVFAGRHGEDTHLYLRPISAAEAAEIPGTAGASSPFLSPDGRWVGFLAEGEIRKTPLAGGPVVKIAELAAGGLPSPSPLMPATRDFFGASWGDDDVIVFGRYQDGLWEVPAGGGVPHRLIGPKGEVHRLPRVLPGGKSILFSVAPRGVTKISVAAMTRGGEPKILVEDATDARFVPPDRLLFVREGILMAAPFDASRLALTGPAVAILSGVLHATHGARPASDTWAALYEVSASGTLVWASGGIYPREPSRLDWVDLDGNAKPLDLPAGQWTRPRISPDGHREGRDHARRPRTGNLGPAHRKRRMGPRVVGRREVGLLPGAPRRDRQDPGGRLGAARADRADRLHPAERRAPRWFRPGDHPARRRDRQRHRASLHEGRHDSTLARDARERSVARVLAGREMDGLRVGRLRALRGLRPAVPRPRSEAAGFDRRRGVSPVVARREEALLRHALGEPADAASRRGRRRRRSADVQPPPPALLRRLRHARRPDRLRRRAGRQALPHGREPRPAADADDRSSRRPELDAGAAKGRRLPRLELNQPSLVDLDGLLAAAVGHGDHEPDTHRNEGADRDPHPVHVREDAELPERREDSGQKEHVAEEKCAHPLHCLTSGRTRGPRAPRARAINACRASRSRRRRAGESRPRQ